ncbi:MAG: class I SAM-dependent methyltransferase [Pseudomonadota bacterium]|nr:class I SAM-dependent methyltransferase [Pseudomonadota bacterium]
MNYKINGNCILSHNAAKPHSQVCKVVLEELRSLTGISSILDIGCGKLRYSEHLYDISKRICFADSKIQLERIQTIKGKKCSVKEYVAHHYPESKTVDVEDFDELTETFDFVFCSNVLSAIPCEKTLNSTIRRIKECLSATGQALVVNQHRSSYFKKFESGKPHLHGYLYSGKRGTSYYGIITKEVIDSLSKKHGLIANSFVKGDRTFAYLKRSSIESTHVKAA